MSEHEESDLTAISDAAPEIGSALRTALDGSFNVDEKNWFSQIEKRRRQLATCSDQIEIVDYGAGPRSLRQAMERMEDGRKIVRLVSELCASASKSEFWGSLLFSVIRSVRPAACLELGACLGISGSFQAAALKLNGVGELFCVEGCEKLSAYCKETFELLRLKNAYVATGRFSEVVPDLLQSSSPFDYGFLDGHHDGAATVAYFEMLSAKLIEPCIIILDDIRWSQGMLDAWNTILSSPRVALSVDLGQMGILKITRVHRKRRSFKLNLRNYFKPPRTKSHHRLINGCPD